MDIDVSANSRMKIKESEKIDKFLDLTSEQKKMGSMRVTVVLIVIGALGTVPKIFFKNIAELEIRGQIETLETTAIVKSLRILRVLLSL